MVPLVKPRIRQLVAGKTTEHVAEGVAVPVAVADTTSEAVFANVKEVVFGTVVIVYTPLNVESTFVTVTVIPGLKP